MTKFDGWTEETIRNMLMLVDKTRSLEKATIKLIADHLSDMADDDAVFEKAIYPPPKEDVDLPVAKGFLEGLLCGEVGTLEPSIILPEGKNRVQICTDAPGHNGACSCEMGWLVQCDQGICVACSKKNPTVDKVKPRVCTACGASLVATRASEYAENPWKDMVSEPTQVPPCTGRAGTGAKGGKKGSKQEAPSSDAKTVSFQLPPAEKIVGIEVADIEHTLKKLRCTTFSIVQKKKDQKAVLVECGLEEVKKYMQSIRKALSGDFLGLDPVSLRFVIAAADAHGMTYMWTYPGFEKGHYQGAGELHSFALFRRVAIHV